MVGNPVASARSLDRAFCHATPRGPRDFFFDGGGNGIKEGETRWQEERYPFGGDWGKGVRELRTKVSLDEKILRPFNVFTYIYISSTYNVYVFSNFLWILNLIYSQPMLSTNRHARRPVGQQVTHTFSWHKLGYLHPFATNFWWG